MKRSPWPVPGWRRLVCPPPRQTRFRSDVSGNRTTGAFLVGRLSTGRYLSVTARRVSNGLFVRDLVTGDTRALADHRYEPASRDLRPVFHNVSRWTAGHLLVEAPLPQMVSSSCVWCPSPASVRCSIAIPPWLTSSRAAGPRTAHTFWHFSPADQITTELRSSQSRTGTVRVVKNLGWRQPKGLKFSRTGGYIVYGHGRRTRLTATRHFHSCCRRSRTDLGRAPQQ